MADFVCNWFVMGLFSQALIFYVLILPTLICLSVFLWPIGAVMQTQCSETWVTWRSSCLATAVIAHDAAPLCLPFSRFISPVEVKQLFSKIQVVLITHICCVLEVTAQNSVACPGNCSSVILLQRFVFLARLWSPDVLAAAQALEQDFNNSHSKSHS